MTSPPATETAPTALTLFVSGAAPRSTAAVATVRAVCDEVRVERVDLSVVDAAEHPALARENDVVALPTLVRVSPRPLRHLVGHLTDAAHVRAWLDQVLTPTLEPGPAVEGDSVP